VATTASTWARESRNSRVITAGLGRVCMKASPSRSGCRPSRPGGGGVGPAGLEGPPGRRPGRALLGGCWTVWFWCPRRRWAARAR